MSCSSGLHARHVVPATDGVTEPPIAALQDWIEQRLAPRAVTPVSMAAAHGMSVLACTGSSRRPARRWGAFVRARRLAGARRDLAAGVGCIAEIVPRWGFSEPSHFARAFMEIRESPIALAAIVDLWLLAAATTVITLYYSP